jgi:hypothetical protein
VGVVESGLFIGRADSVFVADAAEVRRLDGARIHRGGPPVLVLMGVSASGKTTIARKLLALPAGVLRPAHHQHPQVRRHHVQPLSHVLRFGEMRAQSPQLIREGLEPIGQRRLQVAASDESVFEDGLKGAFGHQ